MLGVYLERDRLRAGLTQRQVADELGIKSIRTIYTAESGKWTGDDPPKAVKKLADRFNWVADGVYRVLAGGDVAYNSDAPGPLPMAREVKEQMRHNVTAGQMTAGTKREMLAYIDTIPDAD